VRTIVRQLVVIAVAALLTACSGMPVALGTRASGPVPVGDARTVKGEGCGFQLLLLIPISINDRAERAYMQLEQQAGGDFITDVQVEERWTYALVGTQYCTMMQATAIRPNSR